MTDEDEKAMKNKLFRRLLRKIGVKPPADFNVVRICVWDAFCFLVEHLAELFYFYEQQKIGRVKKLTVNFWVGLF